MGVVLLVVLSYVAYVFLSYHRIEDHQPLEAVRPVEATARIDEVYSITTFNVGFGAYSADFSFFMDGGAESVARSADAVRENTFGALGLITERAPDFAFFQEVDLAATRSHQVDMSALIAEAMPAYSAVFAVNYDSPFLFYPLLQPHGKTLAGIETCSRYRISGAERRSLPIDEGVMKLIDLDRCYSVTRIPVQGGGELCLFNVHLTAYTEDPAIVDGQIAMLFGEMAEEYAAGNYVLCGGDFNRDLWGNSGEVFPTETPTPSWALAFPTEKIPDGFALCRPEGAPVPTCRDASAPYVPGETFVTVLDGFIASDNILCVSVEHVDGGFQYSDHNPVRMEFLLKGLETAA